MLKHSRRLQEQRKQQSRQQKHRREQQMQKVSLRRLQRERRQQIRVPVKETVSVSFTGTIIKTKLEVGDEILTSEGQKISIEKIEIEVLAEPVYVYNFTVEDFHTYFVSELGVYLLE